MKFRSQKRLKPTKIEIIPMIDTMFFLLVFFILTSLGLAKVSGIGVNLPTEQKSTSPAKPDKEAVWITVAIQQSGAIFVNKQEVTPETLGAALTQTLNGKPAAKASIIISAEGKARHGVVVRCMDEARSVGIRNFAIAAPE